MLAIQIFKLSHAGMIVYTDYTDLKTIKSYSFMYQLYYVTKHMVKDIYWLL